MLKYSIAKSIDYFSKAFDTVPHNRLLGKLQYCDIASNLHTWFKSFVKNRSQCVVVVEATYSEKVHVDSRVPQDTVLRQILFVLFILMI